MAWPPALATSASACARVESASEMNMPLDALEKRLQGIAGHRPLFERAYPGEGITRVTVGKAISGQQTEGVGQATQRNASLVNHTTDAAAKLKAETDRLAEAVGVFKLR